MSKGERHREERKRMAEHEQEVNDLLAFDPYTAPDGDYYACSGKQQHENTCREQEDGTRLINDDPHFPCYVIDKWEVGVFIEKMRWQREGLRQEQVITDVLAMDNHLNVLTRLFMDYTGMAQEEFDTLYRKQIYDNMVVNRERFSPMVKKQRTNELIARAMPGPIIGPNGRPIGMN